MAAPLTAECANCQHQRDGACTLGATLPEGEVRCDRYDMTPAFKEQVVSAVLRDGGIEVQMKMKTLARLAAKQSRPVRGFRQTRKKGKPRKDP